MTRTLSRLIVAVTVVAVFVSNSIWAADEERSASGVPPLPPAQVQAMDHPFDGGEQIDVVFPLSPDDRSSQSGVYYVIERSGEKDGDFVEVGRVIPDKKAYKTRTLIFGSAVAHSEELEPFYFRVAAVAPGGNRSDSVATVAPAHASRQLVAGNRLWMGFITLLICSAVVAFIGIARKGKPLKIRKIAGLEAVNEAVGRATEMGRSCLFVPGIQDMNEIQTIAGMTVLSHVAKTAAEYDAKVEVPTSRSLVMTAARETVQGAFLAAGRPDAYNQDLIYYVTDEQFGYVAYLTGMMVREKPAACFYMGAFFAESLILAETGNSIGAIQVAGTAMPAQLPFFVAACDYTLIGEEFFAASAYLSGDADQLGSLKGQDVGKLIVGVLLIAGCLFATLAVPDLVGITTADLFQTLTDYLRDTVLK